MFIHNKHRATRNDETDYEDETEHETEAEYNIKSDIISEIKLWVAIDNQYKKAYHQVIKLRDERDSTSTRIFNHYDSRNVKYPLINISDGKLCLTKLTQSKILSFKFLEECFNEFFKDYENNNTIVEELIEFIKSKRTFNTSKYIKRTYNKNNSNT